MAEDKYIETTANVSTTATTINIFVEYSGVTWLLATGYWLDDDIWSDTDFWIDYISNGNWLLINGEWEDLNFWIDNNFWID